MGSQVVQVILVCIVPALCVQRSPYTELSAVAQSQDVRGAYSFVTLADPQLGMSTQTTDVIDNELTMFKGLAGHIQSKTRGLDPKFVMVLGDMQNVWPHANNNAKANNERDHVKSVMNNLGLPIYYTPGNHDINDLPTAVDVDNYYEHWGLNARGQAMKIGPSNYTTMITINSQIYQTPQQHGVDADSTKELGRQALKNVQKEFLTGGLTAHVSHDTKTVVIMTHIPPFMNTRTEPPGWANWGQNDRDEVLGTIAEVFKAKGVNPKLVWICGHFHTAVENKGVEVTISGTTLNMDIYVTNSAGTSMWWGNANCAGELSPQDAALVAGMPVGGAHGAYVTYILGANPLGGFVNCTEPCMGKTYGRYMSDLPRAERAGLTQWSISADGTLERQWMTLDWLGFTSGNGECKRT